MEVGVLLKWYCHFEAATDAIAIEPHPTLPSSSVSGEAFSLRAGGLHIGRGDQEAASQGFILARKCGVAPSLAAVSASSPPLARRPSALRLRLEEERDWVKGYS